jgi:predicted component of type VI protein secretion system
LDCQIPQQEVVAMEEQPLLIIYDKTTGERWERLLAEDTLAIGREEDCGLALPDRQISRRHATIYREGEHYFLRDEHSRNGTFLNEALVSSPRLLQDGDQIGVASRYRIVFVGSEATAPLYRAGPSRRGLYLDRPSHRVWAEGTEVDPPLSAAQYQLLAYLYDRSGSVVSRDEVIGVIWRDEAAEGISDQAIDALVRRLRDRLAENGSTFQYIETIRGQGFRMNQR